MEKDRTNRITERAPRMPEAARAEIEALRASDRLQRIFEAGPGAPRRTPPRLAADFHSRPAASNAPARRQAGEPPPGGKTVLRSRPMRVLVGLVPVYLAIAVVAADRLSDNAPAGAPIAGQADSDEGQAAAPATKVEPAPDRAPAAETQARAGRPAQGLERRAAAGEPRARSADPDPQSPARERSSAPAATGADAAPPTRRPEGEASARAPAADTAPPAEAASEPVEPVEPNPPRATAESAQAAEFATAALGAATGRGVSAGAEGPEVEQEPGLDTVPQPTWSPPAAVAPLPPSRAAPSPSAPGEMAHVGEPETEPQPAYAAREDEPPDRTGADGPARQAGSAGAASTRLADAAASVSTPRRIDAARTGAAPRIVLHYRGQRGASAARRLADVLRARGLARTEMRQVPYAVSRANVRYFHDLNLPVAREVNGVLQAMGRPSELRDFTHYAPRPSVGTVEVWLPG